MPVINVHPHSHPVKFLIVIPRSYREYLLVFHGERYQRRSTRFPRQFFTPLIVFPSRVIFWVLYPGEREKLLHVCTKYVNAAGRRAETSFGKYREER